MKTIFVEQYAYAFAHHLPDLPVEHECHGLHGHTSTITLTMEVTHEGRIAFDRAALDEVADRVLAPLRYKVINEVPGLEDGLAETQLRWLVDAFSRALLELGAVLVEAELDEMAADRNRLVHHGLLWRHGTSDEAKRPASCEVRVSEPIEFDAWRVAQESVDALNEQRTAVVDGWAVYGNCPVQGYAFVDGWLCYFRARDGWTFSAWSPGSFERVPARLYMSEAETTLIDCVRKDGFSYWNPDFLIEDDLSCPDPGDDENAYPGWWSLAYASKIIYWCVDKLRQHIEQRATDS